MRSQHHSRGRRASRSAVAPVSASEWGDPTGSAVPPTGWGDREEILCPLCIEPLDETEVRFKPCPCGYQVCLFCYERIKLELNGLCPSCRTPYGSPQEASPRPAFTPTPQTPASPTSLPTPPQVAVPADPAHLLESLKLGESSEPPEPTVQNSDLLEVLSIREELQLSDDKEAGDLRQSPTSTSGQSSTLSPEEEVQIPISSASAQVDQKEAPSSGNGNHQISSAQTAAPPKTSQAVWGQSSFQGAPSTSGNTPPSWARPGPSHSDVHRVRQNASEAAVQSSVGFSWGPPVVTSSLLSAETKRRPPDLQPPSDSNKVGEGNVWGSGASTAASVLKAGLAFKSETAPQPVLASTSFPSLPSGVPKPQNPARKGGKRPRTPALRATRNGGSETASGASTPQDSRPGTPLEGNWSEERGGAGLMGANWPASAGVNGVSAGAAVLGVNTLTGVHALSNENGGVRKEDGAAALNFLETKHGRSLSEDVLRGFEGTSGGVYTNGLRPMSSGGVQASTSRLFSGGYGLHRSLSSRASSVASEDSGGSLGGGSPARAASFGKSIYGAALGGPASQGGNGWNVGAASSRQYSEGWTPEALAKARAIIAAARLAQVGPSPPPPPNPTWSMGPETQRSQTSFSGAANTTPTPPLSARLFPSRSEDGLLQQLSEIGAPLAGQFSGLAVTDPSNEVDDGSGFIPGAAQKGGFPGGDFAEGEKVRVVGGPRVVRSQGGSLSRSSSRQNSMERAVESSVLYLVRECESGAETSGEILPDNPWQAPQLFRSVGGPLKPSTPVDMEPPSGLRTSTFQGGSVWNSPFALGTTAEQGLGLGGLSSSGFNGTNYSSFLGTGVSGGAPAVPAAVQEAFNRPIPTESPLQNPFKQGETIAAPFSFGSTKPPTGLAPSASSNSSPISPLANLPPYPAPSFFGNPQNQIQTQPFGSPPFVPPPKIAATSPSSFKSAQSFFDQDFSTSRLAPPHSDASLHRPLFSSTTPGQNGPLRHPELPILPSPPLIFAPPGSAELPFLPNTGPPHQFATNPAPSLSLNFDDPHPRGPARPSANRRSGSRFFKNAKEDAGGGGVVTPHLGGILGNGPPSLLGIPEPPLPISPSAIRRAGGGSGSSSSPKSVESPRSPRTPKASGTPVVNISAAQAAAAAAQTGLQLGSSHSGPVHSELSRSPNVKSPRGLDYLATHNAQARRKSLGGDFPKPSSTMHQQGRGAPNGVGGGGSQQGLTSSIRSWSYGSTGVLMYS